MRQGKGLILVGWLHLCSASDHTPSPLCVRDWERGLETMEMNPGWDQEMIVNNKTSICACFSSSCSLPITTPVSLQYLENKPHKILWYLLITSHVKEDSPGCTVTCEASFLRSTDLYIYVSIYLSIYLSIIDLSIHQSSIYPSINHLSIYQPSISHLSIHLSIIYLSTCLSWSP